MRQRREAAAIIQTATELALPSPTWLANSRGCPAVLPLFRFRPVRVPHTLAP